MLTDDHVTPGPANAAAGSGMPVPGAVPPVAGPPPPVAPAAYLGPVFQRSPVAMAVVDGASLVVEVNEALSHYLGYAADALVGSRLHDYVAPDDVGRLRLGTTERRLRHARGHDLWAVVSTVELPEAGSGATLVCLDDATSRRNTERMLLHAALHDSLTNLPNRRLLRDRLETALVRAHRTHGHGSRCCSSTWTGSRRSTTPSATTPATRCWSRWPTASSARCGPATRWPGSAATSSSWCARTSATTTTLPGWSTGCSMASGGR